MIHRLVLTLTFPILSLLGATQPKLDLVATLAGNGDDHVTALAIDRQGNTYLTGDTTSFDLGTPGTFQPRRASSSLYSYVSATQKFSPLMPATPSPVFRFERDPQRAGTMYAATYSGLMKTTDAGLTWTWLWKDVPSGYWIADFAVAPSQPNVMYAGLLDLVQPRVRGIIYKSSDGGTTWGPVAPLPDPYDSLTTGGWNLAVDPADARHVIASSSLSAYTVDGGASWTLIPVHVYYPTFDPSAPGTVYGYLIDGDVLGKSTDGGRTFSKSTLRGARAILPDSRQPGVVYAAAQGIWKSVDTGSTWSLVSESGAGRLAQDPFTGTLYAMRDGVFASNDGFQTSTRIAPATLLNAIGIPQSGTLLFATDEKREMFVSKLDARGHVVFTTYIGGSFGSSGTAIAVDTSGQIYAAGQSVSADFPVTSSLRDAGSSALYLVKLTADGTRIGYSTRIAGGASGAVAHGLVVDSAGNIYLAGTSDDGYPTTPNSAQATLPPRLASPSIAHTGGFASKLAPDGKTLIYPTYLGTGLREQGKALFVDPDANVYVGGTSLWKLDATGSKVLWIRTMGENPIRGIARDPRGNIYVCGGSYGGSRLPTPGAFQGTAPLYFGSPLDPRFAEATADAFVAKLDALSGNILYATLLGGRYGESANGIVVDAQGNAIVVGTTDSLDFPSRNPFQAPFNKHTGFLAKLNADGSDLMYSTFLGDTRAFDGAAIGWAASGDLILAGHTSTLLQGGDAFVNRIVESQSPERSHVNAVLNAASFFGGPMVPGERIIVRGSGFDASSSVILGDQSLPSILVSDSELRAQVPETIQPGGAAAISVRSADQVSPAIFVNTAAIDPAIFTQGGTGIGPALAFNSDGSQNAPGNPAAKSSTIDIVVNGVGISGSGASIQVYFSGGFPVTPEIRSATVAGERYSILRAAIPVEVVLLRESPQTAGVALTVDGVFVASLFVTTISVQ